MMNLYWKSKDKTRNLVEEPFRSEAEFEEYLFQNQEILGGDVFIIYRQIHTGSKQGIPDMLGVDQDSRVCIVEIKNQEVNENVLPQALGYAMWAEANPDSIKAIWLESKKRPEEIELDWDNLNIRIILIAPSFKSTVPRMAAKIGYPIDLIQVRRYRHEEEEFLIVEALEEKPGPKATTTKVMREWSWEFYESEHGKEATAQFRRVVEALDQFAKKQGWPVPYNLNKYYTGFKLGNRVVFDVAWVRSSTWVLRLKLPQERARSFRGTHWEYQRYEKNFGNAVFRPLQPDRVDVTELEPLLVEAYEYISGRTV